MSSDSTTTDDGDPLEPGDDDNSPVGDGNTTPADNDDSRVTFEDGRYVYCVVSLGDDDDASFSTTGIDDEPVSLVRLENASIAAVVHPCEELYDSADLAEVKRWLVRHQTVIDRAADAFGTPLPFQFDTIIRGDDDTVRGWLREERDRLESTLADLRGHWEYRIDVIEREPPDEKTLLEGDDELKSLRDRIETASEGEAFLLRKQVDQRVKTLRQHRRENVTNRLQTQLEDCTREQRRLERRTSVDLGGEFDRSDAGERLCRLTVMAREADEEAIGSVLDEIAAEPGFEVRFTGPWPPYSFAPTFGDDQRDANR
ncbi:gas vesicle protein GvpL [Natronosalvus vescus]|uniref:gas vesicle protein GvpL n=1 Tax=Natronosalvus vescus TaxID=2953881 RepID=UPI002091613B|nr:GvpL/GvpF family gas vesicle protein [Natronosalvus vescus]